MKKKSKSSRFSMQPEDKENHDDKWSAEFVKQVEDTFESAFQEVYEKHFIEDIFEEYKSVVTKHDFIDSIEEKSFKDKLLEKKDLVKVPVLKGGDSKDKKVATATWAFTPKTYRAYFLKYVNDLDENQ